MLVQIFDKNIVDFAIVNLNDLYFPTCKLKKVLVSTIYKKIEILSCKKS